MVSAPMLISAFTGVALTLAIVALFYLVTSHRPARRHARVHRAFAWTLGTAALLHGIWGLVAIFVLKS